MANCNCDFDNNSQIQDEEESIADRMKDKILYGRELIYFTKKVQDEIASATSDAQNSEEVISAIESAKGEILADVRDMIDGGIGEVNSKLDLILGKLDEIDEKILALTPLKININGDNYIGELDAVNLLDPTNQYFHRIYGSGMSTDEMDDIIAALRAGRPIDYGMGESGYVVVTESDDSEPAEMRVDNGIYNYEIPDGLEVYEMFNNNGNECYIFKNAVILGYELVPSEQATIAQEMMDKIESFRCGHISFEEYMDFFEPYKHTILLCKLNNMVSDVKSGDSYFILTDIPKEDFSVPEIVFL